MWQTILKQAIKFCICKIADRLANILITILIPTVVA